MAAAEKIEAAGAPEPSTSTERSRNEPVGEKWWLYRPKNRITTLEWIYRVPEVHITMEMGGFSPMGVEEAPPICKAEQLNGLPLNRMGPRILYVHNLSFSPHNAQISLLDSHQLHGFFSLGRLDDGRTAITYHILPSSKEAEKLLVEAAKSSSHIADLTVPIHRTNSSTIIR